MASAKISISLDEGDIAYLDAEQLAGTYTSRSAAVHHAIRLLRESRLADAYAEAYGEFSDQDWENASEDGLGAA